MINQIYGSKSSQDIDVLFFVDAIINTKDSAIRSKQFEELLQSKLQCSRQVNANLAVSNGKHLIDVHKGTVDELNNACIFTYSFHEQDFPLQLSEQLKRDVDLKMLRCSRTIISYFTRTNLRIEAKSALKSGFSSKLDFLENLKFEAHKDLGKHGDLIEGYKSIAFQLGQTFGLFIDKELYTKEAISECFPSISPYLFREKINSSDLQEFMLKFVKEARFRVPGMKAAYEYNYEIVK